MPEPVRLEPEENMNKDSLITRNTPQWRFQTWAAFVLSLGLTVLGILSLDADHWIKGYLFMGIIFTVGSCFSLSKTIRDDAEAFKIVNRVQTAKTEKILKEYEP